MNANLPFPQTPMVLKFWTELRAELRLWTRFEPGQRRYDRLARATFNVTHRCASPDLLAMCAAGRLVPFTYAWPDVQLDTEECQRVLEFVEQALATRAPVIPEAT